MPTTSALSRIVTVALAAVVLCLPAVWNGLPFFYPDTPTYLRGAEMAVRSVLPGPAGPSEAQHRPADSPAAGSRLTSLDDRVVLAGRSVYYGTLLHAAQRAGSLWLAVAVQAMAVAYLLHLLLVRMWRVPPAAFLACAAVLSMATPLAVYAGLLMPDVYAGLGILAIATLCVYWRQLPGADRWLVVALLLFALCAHPSHVAVAGLLLLLALALRRWGAPWQGLAVPALGLVGACIVAAIAAEGLFAYGVTRVLGAPPLRLPHTTARLVDMGPGADFLKQHCPEAGYAVCAYTSNYPTPWDAFLFSADPSRGTFALADAATKRRITSQQWHFVQDVVRHDPAGVARGWIEDIVRQLLSFRVDVWSLGPHQLAMYAGRVPADTYAAMKASRGFGAPGYNHAMSVATYVSTLAAAAMAAVWAWRRSRGAVARVPQRFEQVALLTVGGVLANALVCATAAASLDRFQARVIWLLPFLALSVLALAWARRSATVPVAPAAAVRGLREVAP